MGATSTVAVALAFTGLAAAVVVMGAAVWWAVGAGEAAPGAGTEDSADRFSTAVFDSGVPGFPTTSADRISSFEVDQFRMDKNTGELRRLGELGRGPVFLNDLVVVRARFTEAVFPYLLILNPDGMPRLLFPDGEAAAAASDLVHPAGRQEYLVLDSEGFVSLALVLASQPLPGLDEWRPNVDGAAWKQARPATAWLFQGQICEPFVRDRLAFGERAPQAFVDVCHMLRGRPRITALRAIAFTVRPNPEDGLAPDKN
jgi:hypothetical protein